MEELPKRVKYDLDGLPDANATEQVGYLGKIT
jgi:hypothetical protein